jgi:putative tryptophan/tyrosine transport system substrate-binding protein
MRRREFITLLGGAAATWPLAARAQNPAIPVIGFLDSGEPAGMEANLTGFRRGLSETSYTEGQNLAIDYRWAEGHLDRLPALAADLVRRPVAVIAASGPGPCGQGGNLDDSDRVPVRRERGQFRRVLAVLRDSTIPSGTGQFGVIQAVAPSLRVEVNPINMRETGEIDRAIAAFARSPNGGLILTASGMAFLHHNLIITLAARHKLPAVYYERSYIAAGGLISYGPNRIDQFRLAAGYVDRILKGEKPADLPVQAPTKYELIINLKTAKALGITIPPSLLATANEVIE